MLRIAALLALALVAVLALAYLAADATSVGTTIDPDTDQEITTYRVLDRYTVLVSGATNSPSDMVNGLALAGLAGIAALGAVLARVLTPARRDLLWFFGLAALGAGFLAVDEVLELSETLGYNLERHDLPDDLDLVLYGIPALAFLVGFRRILLSSRTALLLAAAAFVLFAGLQLLDTIAPDATSFEEKAEPLATLLFAAAFAVLARSQLATTQPAVPEAAMEGSDPGHGSTGRAGEGSRGRA